MQNLATGLARSKHGWAGCVAVVALQPPLWLYKVCLTEQVNRDWQRTRNHRASFTDKGTTCALRYLGINMQWQARRGKKTFWEIWEVGVCEEACRMGKKAGAWKSLAT